MFSLLTISCNDKKEISQVTLEKVVEIDQLGDSTFISDVRSLDVYNDKIYLTDYQANQVFVLNSEFELLNTMGGPGRGPGEFMGAEGVAVFQDTVYVINDGKQSFELYDEDGHIQTIAISGSRLAPGKRFLISENGLFFSTRNANENINSYKNGRIIDTFGSPGETGSEIASRVKNQRHILGFHNRIIAVSDSRPEIETYDTKGNFISRFNYNEVKGIKQTMAAQPKAENSYIEIVTDAFLNSGNLYLLVLTTDEGEKDLNKVLELEIQEEGFEVNRILDLGEGWFSSFVVNDNYLVASKAGSLVKYKL